MGVARLYRAASPFNASELVQVDAVQSFDVMYMAHLNHDPLKLSRLDHTDWRFSVVPFAPVAPAPTGVAVAVNKPNQDADNHGNAYFAQTDHYVVTAIMADTGQESRPSVAVDALNDLTLKRNSNVVSWSAVVGAESYRVYKAHNEGSYAFIGKSDGLSLTDDYIGGDLTLGPLVARTPFAGAGNKPSTVIFFEQRLWWGRTLNNPNGLWASRSADFENMDISIPLKADDAISIRLVSQGVNQANHLVPVKNLLVFSSDGLFKIEGANEDYLSASPPPRQRSQTGRGSSRLRPLVVESVAFYKTSSASAVRAAKYSFEADGFASTDVSIYSPQFFEGFDIVSWCFAEEPLSVIWAARSDGALLAFTWVEEHEVWGWTICPLAGSGKVKSLCSVRESGEDRVYAIIERTIAGSTRVGRERMASGKWQGLAWENHLDCSVTAVFDTPSNVIAGLWHLEGETVAAFADGLVFEGLVVANGRVSLPEDYACRIAHVGLPFDAIAETLPLNFQTPRGPAAGRTQQVGNCMVKLNRSRGVLVGVDPAKLRPLKVPAHYVDQTSEASLLTGDFTFETDAKVALSVTATIKQRIAPMTVLAVYLDAAAI